jgi:PleD family two-component response regulator
MATTAQARVLVVDGDVTQAAPLRGQLIAAGYAVWGAAHWAQVAMLLRQARPQLVLIIGGDDGRGPRCSAAGRRRTDWAALTRVST